jgi:hypothetical protein
MQTSNFTPIRLGALMLALSAVLFFAGPALTPFFESPTNVLEQTGWLFIIAMTLFPCGMLAVYAHLNRQPGKQWAGVAFIFQLLALGPLQAFAGLDTLALSPTRRLYFQESSPEVFRVMATIMQSLGESPFGFYSVFVLGMVILDLGMLALAIAIWRSGTLSKWAGVLYALGFVLFIGAAFTPAGNIFRLIDGVIGGIGGVWLAWSLWQQKSV